MNAHSASDTEMVSRTTLPDTEMVSCTTPSDTETGCHTTPSNTETVLQATPSNTETVLQATSSDTKMDSHSTPVDVETDSGPTPPETESVLHSTPADTGIDSYPTFSDSNTEMDARYLAMLLCFLDCAAFSFVLGAPFLDSYNWNFGPLADELLAMGIFIVSAAFQVLIRNNLWPGFFWTRDFLLPLLKLALILGSIMYFLPSSAIFAFIHDFLPWYAIFVFIIRLSAIFVYYWVWPKYIRPAITKVSDLLIDAHRWILSIVLFLLDAMHFLSGHIVLIFAAPCVTLAAVCGLFPYRSDGVINNMPGPLDLPTMDENAVGAVVNNKDNDQSPLTPVIPVTVQETASLQNPMTN